MKIHCSSVEVGMTSTFLRKYDQELYKETCRTLLVYYLHHTSPVFPYYSKIGIFVQPLMGKNQNKYM